MKIKQFLFAGGFYLLHTLCITAQTDVTNKIVNPSFEDDGLSGWKQSGMSAQNNDVFNIKQGKVYAEKWTGRGGAVGSGYVSQTVTGLAPGNYELKVAAQNIQEDTPTAAKTGACIFGENKETAVTVKGDYTVAFNVVTGEATIGFRAVNATGNYICCDNFRLQLVGTDLSAELDDAINTARSAYGTGTGLESARFLSVIKEAETVATDVSASGQQQADAIIKLQKAEQAYRLANASSSNPLDMTYLILNPSFENEGFAEWVQSGMQLQGNTAFSIKKGNTYAEKWTGQGFAVGDAFVRQTLKKVPLGTYRLTVAAQNIQEGTPSKVQTGACIFAGNQKMAVGIRKNYVLEFVVASGEVTIGFLAEKASGNWICCDNFRLEYIDSNPEAVMAKMQSLIDEAESIKDTRMNSSVLQDLLLATQAAREIVSLSQSDEYAATAKTLEDILGKAHASIDAFTAMQQIVDEMQALCDASDAPDKSVFQAAIDAAKAVNSNLLSTNEELAAATAILNAAAFTFRVENGTGAVPTVTTDARFARGATQAFFRSNIVANGVKILERGVCWSESPEPQITDFRTTDYLDNNGRIYWVKDLKPATVYYVRAYALTDTYAVGYGDPIKVITLPKGEVTWWYNNGADAEGNARINAALKGAVDYWNDLTNITGMGVSCSYGSGTPTADCGYGGGMRIGPNPSYQQIGTVMHEMLHAIGVGTHYIWSWSDVLRSEYGRGMWLGDRATEVLRFWDNDDKARLTGDGMHMWPYGINGAQEDSHSPALYICTSLLAQALGEDGLPCSGSRGFASPAYVFNHEENVKYYIKSEDENCGFYDSYLVEDENHKLVWKKMTADEAAADDNAGWYVSFTPKNQYYQLRNAASGYYMTYSSGNGNNFITASRTSVTQAENFHFMRSRTDMEIKVNGQPLRGYWMIHPESNATPPCLGVKSDGSAGVLSFNIADNASKQRWVILTFDEASQVETGAVDMYKNLLYNTIAQIREMAATPHTEDIEGTNDMLETKLTAARAEGEAANSALTISSLITEVREAGMAFLASVTPKDMEQPFQLSFLITNPRLDEDAVTGWTSAPAPTYGNQAAEYYQTKFDYNQLLTGMPKGTYQLRVQAFHRPGTPENVFSAYSTGNSKVGVQIYAGDKVETVKNLMDDRQPSELFNDGGWGKDSKLSDGTYVPNSMGGAAKYFSKGLYDNKVTIRLTENNSPLLIGIKGITTGDAYWCMFDNFRLYYYGSMSEQAVGISYVPMTDNDQVSRFTDDGVYTLQGIRVGDSFQNLPQGIYIHKGQKYIIK